MILCDSDVLIEHLRGRAETTSLLKNYASSGLAVSAVSVMEIYFGAKDKKELNTLRKALAALTLIPVSEEISGLATDLVFRYAKSHSLSVPDALIAGTAIVHDLNLLTYNQKHFSHINKLSLVSV